MRISIPKLRRYLQQSIKHFDHIPFSCGGNMVIFLGKRNGCAGGAKPPPVLAGVVRSVCSLPLRVFASVSLTHPACGPVMGFSPTSPCSAFVAYKDISSLAYPPFVAAAWLNSSIGEVQPHCHLEGRITPKEKNMFSSYVCPGDSVIFEHGKFTFNVSLEYDDFSTPYEWECYSDLDIRRWKDDDWYYGGLVVSVSYNEIGRAHV